MKSMYKNELAAQMGVSSSTMTAYMRSIEISQDEPRKTARQGQKSHFLPQKLAQFNFFLYFCACKRKTKTIGIEIVTN